MNTFGKTEQTKEALHRSSSTPTDDGPNRKLSRDLPFRGTLKDVMMNVAKDPESKQLLASLKQRRGSQDSLDENGRTSKSPLIQKKSDPLMRILEAAQGRQIREKLDDGTEDEELEDSDIEKKEEANEKDTSSDGENDTRKKKSKGSKDRSMGSSSALDLVLSSLLSSKKVGGLAVPQRSDPTLTPTSLRSYKGTGIAIYLFNLLF